LFSARQNSPSSDEIKTGLERIMAEQWYYQAFDQEFGPLTLDELAEMYQEGTLSGNDLVREGKKGGWCAANEAQALTSLVAERAEVATDIDHFLLMDEKRDVTASAETETNTIETNAEIATDIDSFLLMDEKRETRTTAKRDPDEGATPGDSRGMWYFQSIGQEFGPVPFSELLELVSRSEIGPEDSVRKGETGQWVPAGLIDGLFSDAPNQATQTATRQNDRFATPSGMAESKTAQAASRKQAAPGRPTAPRSVAYQSVDDEFSTDATTTFETTESNETGWYCFLNEQEYGPVDFTELQGYAAAGQITPEVYVKFGVNGEWTLASQVPRLFVSAAVEVSSQRPASHSVAVPMSPSPQMAPGTTANLADSERMELAHQLLALLKQEITPGLLAASAPPTTGGWYCNISGSIVGPVAIDSLVQMVLQKRIFADDLIRLGTQGEWFPAKTVPELFPQQALPGTKKSGLDDGNNVLSKIDKMYREAEEAKKKAAAEQAKAPPATESDSKPAAAKPAASGDVFRNINNSIARAAVEGKPKAASSSSSGDSLGDQLNDLLAKLNMGSAGGVIVAVAVVLLGLGYYFGPGLMEGYRAGSAYEGMMKVHSEIMKAHSAGGGGSAAGAKKKIKELMTSVKGGRGASPLRDVSKMGLYLQEMAEYAGAQPAAGVPPEEDPFTIAQERFKSTQKKAAKKLGKKP